MKKVMLFIASMLFAVSASAATLTLTSLSPNGAVTWSPDSVVSGTASRAGSEAIDNNWGITTDQTTNSVFNFGFARLINGASTSINVDNAGYELRDSTTALIASDFSLNALGFKFGALLTAGNSYFLNIFGDATGFNPTTTLLSVQAVPVPAALFLFAPALLGFLGLRRKATALVA